MSRRRSTVLALVLCAPLAARASDHPPLAPRASDDTVLDGLVREALESSPEYAAARASVAADRERVAQAGALGDPTLTLGIQNDGFQRIEIGNMETSFWQVMVTQ